MIMMNGLEKKKFLWGKNIDIVHFWLGVPTMELVNVNYRIFEVKKGLSIGTLNVHFFSIF